MVIVYYAPREEKPWTVHSSYKLTNWQTRTVGWPIFLPWCVYYFSSYPGRKYHIRVFEPGTKVVLSVRVWRKVNFMVLPAETNYAEKSISF